ncbi:MAG: hypothetical protein AAF602_08100, partial [Myxococcota bacterium]
MAGFLVFGIALGSTLSVDAKLPTEVLVDGRKVAEVWEPAQVTVEVPPGSHLVRIYRGGTPADLDLTFPAGETIELVVGRTGITTNLADPEREPEPAGDVPVELRALEATQVRLGKQRLVLGDGEDQTLDLPVGTHPISIRNPAGTVIWAKGQLVVDPGARLVVQITS